MLVSQEYLVNHTDLFSCVQRESQERSGAVPCDGRWGLGGYISYGFNGLYAMDGSSVGRRCCLIGM